MVKRHGQAEVPGRGAFETLDLLLQALKGGQDGLGEPEEPLPGLGEAQLALADPLDEAAAQLALQGLDLLAQGRLGAESGLRRPGEASLLGHLVKTDDLLPFHK